MKRIEFYLGIGYPGAEHKEMVEFDDNATDEEIEECFEDWKNDYIDAGWQEAED